MKFHERLKKMRLAANLKQRDICRRTRLSASFFSDMENGKRGVSAENLRRVARVIGVSMDELFTGKKR